MAELGRPSGYKPEFAAQAQKLCEFGATDRELADFFEVSAPTIWRWACEFQDFCSAIKAGKAAADERVERSLYHKAIGYTFESVKIFNGPAGVVKVPYTEHVAPDTTACIFWLKNRRKDQWRDVHKHEHGGVGDFDRMSDDQLRDFIQTGTVKAGESKALPKPAAGSNGTGTKPH